MLMSIPRDLLRHTTSSGGSPWSPCQRVLINPGPGVTARATCSWLSWLHRHTGIVHIGFRDFHNIMFQLNSLTAAAAYIRVFIFY